MSGVQNLEQIAAGVDSVIRLMQARAAVWLAGDPQDPVERAYQVCEVYQRLKDARYDQEATTSVVAAWLDQFDGMPDRETFRRMADYAAAEEAWRAWREGVETVLRTGDEDNFAIARRVAEVRLFNHHEIGQYILAHPEQFPKRQERLGRIREMGKSGLLSRSEAAEMRSGVGTDLYRLCQGWYRCKPPLVTKVRTDVYQPTEEFLALFSNEPLRPDPLEDLPPYPGGRSCRIP